MSFKHTPFEYKEISNPLDFRDCTLYLKETNSVLHNWMSVIGFSSAVPYFYENSWYIFFVEEGNIMIDKPMIKIMKLEDNKLVDYHTITFDDSIKGLNILDLYIPRLTNETIVDKKDGFTFEHINFENEKCSTLKDGTVEKSGFEEMLENKSSPMEHIKYANYILISMINTRMECTLHAIEFSDFSKKEFKAKNINLPIEAKPLHGMIRHLDFDLPHCFDRFFITEVYSPEPYEDPKDYLIMLNMKEIETSFPEKTTTIEDDIKKILQRVDPYLELVSNKGPVIRILTFKISPELLKIVEEELNKLPIKCISENQKTSI